MRPRRRQGLVLVPMAIVLAAVGALAWAMVREASMSVAMVGLDYDAQVARYLAQAGQNLAKWQNRQIGCASAVQFGSFSLPGGTVTTHAVVAVTGGLSIDVGAVTASGRTLRLVNDAVPVYSGAQRTTVAWKAGSSTAADTYIVAGDTTPNGSAAFMALTDGTERGLVQFALTSLGDILIVGAQLKLFQTSTGSSATSGSIHLHRVTTAWSQSSATWTYPWTTPGGDFIATPVAVLPVSRQTGLYYTVRIDALADAWMTQRLPNYGVLLISSGMDQAHLGTLEDDANPPELVLDYYPRCT